MTSTCANCGAFAPYDVCSLCGHRRRNPTRIVLWALVATLAVIAVAVGTLGILRPLLASDEASPTAAAVAPPSRSDLLDEQLAKLSVGFSESSLLDVSKLRADAQAAYGAADFGPTRAYLGALVAYLQSPSPTPASLATLRSRSKAAVRSYAGGKSDIRAALAAGPLLDPTTLRDPSVGEARPPRAAGWFANPSRTAVCFLAVHEVTCLTLGSAGGPGAGPQLLTLDETGAQESTPWLGSPWPPDPAPEDLLDAVDTPDGKIRCRPGKTDGIDCFVITSPDDPHLVVP